MLIAAAKADLKSVCIRVAAMFSRLWGSAQESVMADAAAKLFDDKNVSNGRPAPCTRYAPQLARAPYAFSSGN